MLFLSVFAQLDTFVIASLRFHFLFVSSLRNVFIEVVLRGCLPLHCFLSIVTRVRVIKITVFAVFSNHFHPVPCLTQGKFGLAYLTLMCVVSNCYSARACIHACVMSILSQLAAEIAAGSFSVCCHFYFLSKSLLFAEKV